MLQMMPGFDINHAHTLQWCHYYFYPVTVVPPFVQIAMAQAHERQLSVVGHVARTIDMGHVHGSLASIPVDARFSAYHGVSESVPAIATAGLPCLGHHLTDCVIFLSS